MTIGRSFLLWLLGVLIATLILVSALVLWHERGVLESELEKQSRLLARTLALAASEGGAPEYLTVISTGDLRVGEVRRRDGQVLWRYGPPLDEAAALDLSLMRIDESVEVDRELWGQSDTVDVVLLVSRARIDRVFAGAAVRLVTALGMVLALALVLGLGLVGRVVRPLKELADSVRTFDPEEPPRLTTGDSRISEVRELARAFEEMTQRLAEQRRSLASSERRFRELFGASPTPLLELDDQLGILGANPAAAGFLGRDHGDDVAGSISRFVEGVSTDELASALAAAYLAEEAVVEARWRLADGDSAEVELHVRPTGDERSPGMLMAIHDMTDRVRRLGQRWQRTFDAMEDGVALVDGQGEITQSNRALHRHLPSIRASLVARAADFGEAEWRLESEGRLLQCSLTSPEGFGHSILVARDTTDAERAQARLREAEKMEAVGTLASGVAHDFNNLLAAILLHVRWLLRDPDVAVEAGGAIRDLADEGTEVVRELLLFARRESTPPRTVDLIELIATHEGVLRHLMPDSVELRLKLPEAVVPVVGNPVALRRMLLNLVVNGRDAAPKEGGRVEVALEAAGGEAVLEVSDNGPGVPVELRHRLFEPFVSSRRQGRGAGLGLAVVYAIVTEHRGEIVLDPTAEHGARFVVRLPLGRESDIEPVPVASADEESQSGARVVLVEGDGRRATRMIEAFAEAGLDVRHAPTLAQAAAVVGRWMPEAVVSRLELADGNVVDELSRWELPAVLLGASSGEAPWAGRVVYLEDNASPEHILAALQRLGVRIIAG